VNINPAIDIPQFRPMVLQVMSDFRAAEGDVTDRNNAQYRLRIAPYRATDNKVEGAVITVVELSRRTENTLGETAGH
jgi:two-component system, chemotaxis family, CheB/CheR fusion protein